MIVRFFAGAAEAAGGPQREIDTREPVTLAQIKADIAGDDVRLARVLAVSSVLADGARLADDDVVPPGSTLDVLPPFAGG